MMRRLSTLIYVVISIGCVALVALQPRHIPEAALVQELNLIDAGQAPSAVTASGAPLISQATKQTVTQSGQRASTTGAPRH